MSENSKKIKLLDIDKRGKKIIVASGFGVSTDTKKVLDILMEQGIPFEYDTRVKEGVHETYEDPYIEKRNNSNKYSNKTKQKESAKRNVQKKKASRSKMLKKTKKQQRRKK